MKPQVSLVDAAVKDVVYESGRPIEQVVFPVTAVGSMLNDVEGEPLVEVATIGREGMAGLPVFLGVNESPNRVVIQIEGSLFRMAAADLRKFLLGDGVLHAQLHRYVQATIVQLSQNWPVTGCTAPRNVRPGGC